VLCFIIGAAPDPTDKRKTEQKYKGKESENEEKKTEQSSPYPVDKNQKATKARAQIPQHVLFNPTRSREPPAPIRTAGPSGKLLCAACGRPTLARPHRDCSSSELGRNERYKIKVGRKDQLQEKTKKKEGNEKRSRAKSEPLSILSHAETTQIK
jgi:hypothetical protein